MFWLSILFYVVTIATSFELSTTLVTTRIRAKGKLPSYNSHDICCQNSRSQVLLAQVTSSDENTSDSQPTTPCADVAVTIDIKKEGVKIFGRLAEKYIALDSSGGNCCYSGCTGCEYRLPGGGYKMADQTASRPKWIPQYDIRSMNDKQHITKWYTNLYQIPNVTAITKDEFVDCIVNLEYSPPLGGPYISASSSQITDTTTVQNMFDIIAEGKTKLTKYKMSVRIKQLSNGDEGMTWQSFERMIESIV